MYPLSLSVTNSGNTFSTSCAITPTFGNDCCNSSALSFQSQVTPLSDCTFSIGLEISSILSFNLSSEEAYATTSPATFNAPPIPTPPTTTRAPTSVAFVAVVFVIVITPLAESSAFERRKLLEVKPSSLSAFRLVTFVVEVTANGAVPVATEETNCELNVLAPLNVCVPLRCAVSESK